MCCLTFSLRVSYCIRISERTPRIYSREVLSHLQHCGLFFVKASCRTPNTTPASVDGERDYVLGNRLQARYFLVICTCLCAHRPVRHFNWILHFCKFWKHDECRSDNPVRDNAFSAFRRFDMQHWHHVYLDKVDVMDQSDEICIRSTYMGTISQWWIWHCSSTWLGTWLLV